MMLGVVDLEELGVSIREGALGHAKTFFAEKAKQ